MEATWTHRNEQLVSDTISSVFLKPGREKSLRHRHPWVFSGAIERVEGAPGMGETVTVAAHDGSFLAHAAWCPQS